MRMARKTMAAQTQAVVEAHRGLRIVENLRETEFERWTRERDRETEAFAGEAFLARAARTGKANSSR
jgi:hypothetical protein